MSGPSSQPLASWRLVKAELQRRIRDRIWKPGERIPTEAELAQGFGCARATVNRAMRELAAAGLLERRRKGGTRVVENPARRATVQIPVLRLEVEQRGARWSQSVLRRRLVRPGAAVAARLSIEAGMRALHLRSLHRADGRPYAYEDRWVNLSLVPGILDVDLNSISANEWLVGHAPFTHGEIFFSAGNASSEEAGILETATGHALFRIDRTTYMNERGITWVRLVYAPGHSLRLTV